MATILICHKKNVLERFLKTQNFFDIIIIPFWELDKILELFSQHGYTNLNIHIYHGNIFSKQTATDLLLLQLLQ